jgi:carboxymethylenebutenolidase
MSEFIKLKAADEHEFDAYVASPAGNPIAGLVLVQEIFGVNKHIRSVADSYAKDGFLVVAPAIFDRYERGLDLGYEGADLQKAMSFFPKLNIDDILKDIAASLEYARKKTAKKVGVVGYCLGGTIAWLSAARLHVDAAVGYYGGMIANFANENVSVPVQLHFGNKDKHISQEDRDKVSKAHPDVPMFVYDADHGFNCDARGSYDAHSAKLARERALEFFKTHLVS